MELMQWLNHTEQICGHMYGHGLSHVPYSYVFQRGTIDYYNDIYSFW